MTTVISVENLSKQYHLGTIGTGTLAHDLNRWWARMRGKPDPLAKVGSGQWAVGSGKPVASRQSTVNSQQSSVNSQQSSVNSREHPTSNLQLPTSNSIWALRDVSFEVKQGEVLGIIGRNGAGKSTLLKILSRVTAPTFGEVKVKGRIASLLEVGTGFHPELTGRENIFLNGAILGMSRREIERKFDEIVAFAEVEKFIDTPVKRYSSGMYVRLAFAVAAHLEPEILLVDEVLAVGDAAFQKKCLGKMGDVAKEGRTVLFVSHNMGAVRELCKRGLWLNQGAVNSNDDIERIVQIYLTALAGKAFAFQDPRSDLIIENIILKNTNGEQTVNFYPGENLIVEIWFDTRRKIESPYVWLSINSIWGPCFAANMLLDGMRPKELNGKGCLVCRFDSIPLLPQGYSIKMAIRQHDGIGAILSPREVASFNIIGDLRGYGFKGQLLQSVASKSVPLIIPYTWILPDGRKESVQLARAGEEKIVT